MRTFTFSTVSFLFVGLAACNGGSAEDCSDNADNDGDAAVDCDDSECATDAACDDTNDTKDTTVDEEDCAAEGDEDDDGDADCADSDCAEGCDELLAFIEIGHATVTATTWSGDGSQGWELYPIDATTLTDPESTFCHVTFDSTGAEHANAADCAGCDWAFEVTFDNTSAETGTDCAGFPLTDAPPFNVDGNAYGYGYNPSYESAPALMYYVPDDAEWLRASGDATYTGTAFAYSYTFAGYYY